MLFIDYNLLVEKSKLCVLLFFSARFPSRFWFGFVLGFMLKSPWIEWDGDWSWKEGENGKLSAARRSTRERERERKTHGSMKKISSQVECSSCFVIIVCGLCLVKCILAENAGDYNFSLRMENRCCCCCTMETVERDGEKVAKLLTFFFSGK